MGINAPCVSSYVFFVVIEIGVLSLLRVVHENETFASISLVLVEASMLAVPLCQSQYFAIVC